ncbi:MAG: VWA domain-containing protein [Candidatus Adiutrix sp.]|jgi:uncharacterized protein YegL|nr:VWA domain-containing protein [Candidatus Adiutrix sp.]
MRKLPIYILLDTSGSMRGEPIEAVRSGLQSLLSSLRRDPYAVETVYLSVITFDREARVITPMTELAQFVLPVIPPLESSPTNMGEALELMLKRYDEEVVKADESQKGDWLPMAVVMTDGAPSDTLLFEEMCGKIRQYRFAHVIGCAAGPKAKTEPLRKFATRVVALETMDSSGFSQFWQWVSLAVSRHSQTTDITLDELPPPPAEIKLAL